MSRSMARLTRAQPAQIMVALTAITSVCFVAIKAGLPFAPPLLFGGLRALLGGLVLLGAVAVRREALLPARWAWPWILALALTATTVTFGAMFLSPGRTGAGLASVLGNMQPLAVVLLAAPVLGERLTRRAMVSLALGLLGVILMTAPALAGPDAVGISGVLLALAASVGAALGSVLVKRMGRPSAVLAVTAWQLIVGSLPLLGLSALVEHGARVVWSAEFVGLLLFLAVVGTAFTTAVWYWLVQRHDVGRLSLFFFLVPVFGLTLAALAFGERVSPFEGLGVGVIVIGIITVAAERSPHAAPQGQATLSRRLDRPAHTPDLP